MTRGNSALAAMQRRYDARLRARRRRRRSRVLWGMLRFLFATLVVLGSGAAIGAMLALQI